MRASRLSTFDAFTIHLFSICMLCLEIKSREIEASQKEKKVILFCSQGTAGVYMIH